MKSPVKGVVGSSQINNLDDCSQVLIVVQAVDTVLYNNLPLPVLPFRSKYSNTQNRSAVRVIDRTGHYIGISINCESVFRLGQVLALFPWLKRTIGELFRLW